MNTVITSFSKDNVRKAYQEADEQGKKMLSTLFGKDTVAFDYTNIQTFEDACAFTNTDANDERFHQGRPDEIARKELEVITLAINGGVVLSNKDITQKKWRGWFEFTPTGFRFYYAHCDYAYSLTGAGSRLAFLDEPRQVHAAKYFLSRYELMQS